MITPINLKYPSTLYFSCVFICMAQTSNNIESGVRIANLL